MLSIIHHRAPFTRPLTCLRTLSETTEGDWYRVSSVEEISGFWCKPYFEVDDGLVDLLRIFIYFGLFLDCQNSQNLQQCVLIQVTRIFWYSEHLKEI